MSLSTRFGGAEEVADGVAADEIAVAVGDVCMDHRRLMLAGVLREAMVAIGVVGCKVLRYSKHTHSKVKSLYIIMIRLFLRVSAFEASSETRMECNE